MSVTSEIGAKIKYFRKSKHFSLQEMADLLYKSKSTLSKYENGQISIDIETLYAIAKVLGVHVEQLLYSEPMQQDNKALYTVPAFFRTLSQFYIYYYDGRIREISRCVVDILSQAGGNHFKVMMYMNIESYEHYQNCENTYFGFLHHYDALSKLTLTNRDNPMEQVTITILASFLDAPSKMGLFTGISSRPMMPVATKVMISKKKQREDAALVGHLKISKEDIKTMKLYNMFTVT